MLSLFSIQSNRVGDILNKMVLINVKNWVQGTENTMVRFKKKESIWYSADSNHHWIKVSNLSNSTQWTYYSYDGIEEVSFWTSSYLIQSSKRNTQKYCQFSWDLSFKEPKCVAHSANLRCTNCIAPPVFHFRVYINWLSVVHDFQFRSTNTFLKFRFT